jgi:hypothetical protein
MPAGAALGTAGGTGQTTRPAQQGNQNTPPVAMVPFVRASQQHSESAVDISRAMTAGDQDLGSIPIPAYGFIRALIVMVEGSGSVVTGTTVTADAPFSAVKNIALAEPNGATIYQANSGFDAAMIQKYGGYRGNNDPRRFPDFAPNTAASMNFKFFLRIPLEINLRDALGSLPNQNSAAQFQLRMTLSAYTAIATGGTVTTPPTVRIRIWNEEWDQPETASEAGTNETEPPAINTTQYWSVQQFPVTVGQAAIRLTRMGNYLRNLILIYRDNTGARVSQDSANWPSPMELRWDTRPQELLLAEVWKERVYERYGYSKIALGGGSIAFDTAGGLDTGLMPFDFAHEFSGQVGLENRDLWLPTLGSTRLEFFGTWGLTGTLYVLTNDVSVAGDVFL